MRAVFGSIGDIQTRWHQAGDSGAPVLLIHGAGVSGASWLKVIDPLARDFRVVAPDTLGHGFTMPGPLQSGPPHPAMIAHLARLVDDLGWQRFHVVGSSFGALLGALLYFHMPDRVERLVVVSSGSFANSDEELAGSLQEALANGLAAMDDPTYDNCRRRMERICHDKASVAPEMIVMQMTEYALPWAREAFERRVRGMMDIEACKPYRVLHRLESIEVPTLMLWGRNDTRGLYASALRAVERIPDARLIAFDHCKHHPQLEHPQVFADVVARFLKGHDMEVYGDLLPT